MKIQQIESLITDKLPIDLRHRLVFNFQPHVNLEQAHFSTDVLFRQAAIYRFDPCKLGKAIAAEFIDHPDFLLLSEQGYLNVFYKNIDLIPCEFLPAPAKHKIFLPPADFINNNSSFLRLYSGSVLQSLLAQKLNITVEFYYGESERAVSSFAELKQQIIADLANTPARQSSKYTDFLIKQINLSSDPLTLWFSPECLPKNIYSRFYQDNFKTVGHRIVCPPKLYLQGLEFTEQKYFLSISGDDYLRAMIQLAGPAEAEAISLVESSLAVKANLTWYAQSLLKRLPVMSTINPSVLALAELSELEKNLVIYSVNLTAFIRSAVINGSVRDLLAVTFKLTDGINLYFNSPDLRRRLYEDKLSPKEIYIITVVRQALSAILTMF